MVIWKVIFLQILWRKFGRRLEVYIPPKDFILAHKLVAGRDKDLDDIEVLLDELGIRNRKQAQKIIDTYIKKDVQRVEGAQSTLDTFFPDYRGAKICYTR